MAEIIYRYKPGDVLRLCHGNPLISVGDYVLLQVGDTVAMAKLIHSPPCQTLSRKRVYLQITDLCQFEETGRHCSIDELASKRAAPVSPNNAATAQLWRLH